MRMKLGNGTQRIIVDKNVIYGSFEYYTYIEKEGPYYRKLVTVCKEKNKDYEVLVYADENDGDYTHKFTI